MGTQVTGTAATKAGDAATAKYPGTVNGVMKTSDGSYRVMVTTSAGARQMVKVSAAFKVTGLDTSMPSPPSGSAGGPNGAAPPSGGTAPTTPPTTPSSSTTSNS